MKEAEKQLNKNAIDSSATQKTAQDANEKEAQDKTAYRVLSGWWAILIRIVAVSFSMFQLYTAAFGAFPTQIQRATHLGFALCLGFLLYPSTKKRPRDRIDLRNLLDMGDIFLALLGTWVCAYVVINYEAIMFAAGRSTPMDLFHGAIIILLVLEITRRIVGLPLAIIAVFFIAYAYWGNHIPGLLGHKGFAWKRILYHLYLTTEGIIGVPIGVSTEFVFLFILFGAFLQKSGLGKLFIDLALAFTGQYAGGPAKVVVVSSCLFGTICGSSIANAATTGPFTIPLMKSIGYRKEFAAAVEAAASTGGQILPPIMGAAAFIMCQYVGVPYLEIAKAAAIPALLYFLAVFIMVHFEAKRMGLKGLPKDQLPDAKKTLLGGWHLLTPVVVIVYMLLNGYSASMAALYGVFSTVIVAVGHAAIMLCIKISKEGNVVRNVSNFIVVWTRIIIEALETGARSALSVASACACAGIIIGIVTLSGVGLKIANTIVTLAGGLLFPTLVLTMIASILLGLGLPTTAKYIILAAIAAPAIQKLGVTMLAAHMFILYFGVFADITPPVALVTFTTAGIARADANKSCLIAVKLALAGFIVPFILIYSPGLLLLKPEWAEIVHWAEGIAGFIPGLTERMALKPELWSGVFRWANVLIVVAKTIVGISALAFVAAGYWRRNLYVVERLIVFAAAIALIFPGYVVDMVGLALMAVVYLTQKWWPDDPLKPAM
jgi:TRAP transporter 4TM/12TM fusion protein